MNKLQLIYLNLIIIFQSPMVIAEQPPSPTFKNKGNSYEIKPQFNAVFFPPQKKVNNNKPPSTKSINHWHILNKKNIGQLISLKPKKRHYPVAINQKNGNWVVLPSTIRVQLKEISKAEKISADYSLQLQSTLPPLKYAFFKVDKIRNIVEIHTLLKKDSRIINAEIEIIEYPQTIR